MTAPRKPRRLMAAERLARIARELVYVAPGAPWFLTLLLDTPVDPPLGLTESAPNQPKGHTMFNIESAAGTVLRKGYKDEIAAEDALKRLARIEGGPFLNAEVVPA